MTEHYTPNNTFLFINPYANNKIYVNKMKGSGGALRDGYRIYRRIHTTLCGSGKADRQHWPDRYRAFPDRGTSDFHDPVFQSSGASAHISRVH